VPQPLSRLTLADSLPERAPISAIQALFGSVVRPYKVLTSLGAAPGRWQTDLTPAASSSALPIHSLTDAFEWLAHGAIVVIDWGSFLLPEA